MASLSSTLGLSLYVMTTALDPPRATALHGWVLAASGLLIAAVGGVWWAWDADPSWGQILLVAGLLVAAAGFLIARRPGVVPGRAVTAAAVSLALFASYQLWQAIATIESQAASHLT